MCVMFIQEVMQMRCVVVTRKTIYKRIAVAVSAVVFAVLALLQAGQVTWLDQTVASWMTALQSPAVLGFFRVITFFGEPQFFTALCVVMLLGNRFRAKGWLFAVSALLVGGVNQLLKAIFQRTRPAAEWMLTTASGYSFPSGHAMGAMAIYGMLIYLVWHSSWPARVRKAVVTVLAVLILLIGISRVVLRVHYTTDVLAGWAAGLVYLFAVLTAFKQIRRVLARRSAKSV